MKPKFVELEPSVVLKQEVEAVEKSYEHVA